MDEDGEPSPVGYGRVATTMALDADLHVLRAFKSLNARNILYLQSELMELEETLSDLDKLYDDRSKGNQSWSVPRSWRAVKNEGGEYLHCVEQIRQVSKDYYEATQVQAWLLSLKYPTPRAINSLRSFLKSQKTDMSQADASFILDPKHQPDLVALHTNEKEVLSELLEKYLYRSFLDKGRHVKSRNGRILFVSETRISSFVRFIAIVMSSVLPVLSIVVLYYVNGIKLRLGCIVLFSTLCSGALATLSNARNVEIIGATAAFAAVQVVFVSGDPGSVQP